MVYDTKKGDENMENRMEHRYIDGTLIVNFFGEVDSTNAAKYRVTLDALIEKNKGDVVFNFKHVGFIDSSGIGLVLGRYNQLLKEDRKLVITSLNPTAYKVFELTGIFKIMEYREEIKC